MNRAQSWHVWLCDPDTGTVHTLREKGQKFKFGKFGVLNKTDALVN